MMLALWILLAALILVLLLSIIVLCAKWQIFLIYSKGDFAVKVGKVCVFSSKKEKEKRKKGADEDKYIKILKLSLEMIKEKIAAAKELYGREKSQVAVMLQDMNENIETERLDLSVRYGFGDAAVTGLANGVIWGAITAAVTVVQKNMDVNDKVSVALKPEYSQSCFEADALFVFRTRFIRFYGVAVRARKLYKRNKETIDKIRF